MMRGRDGKGPPSTDLLVCFPSRAHLSLMPKPICSPARPSDSSSSSSSFHRRRRSHHQLRHSGNRGGGGGHGSPLMWAAAKAKHNRNNNNNSDGSEPSSPKVTCAGQIKVRSTSKQASSCKNWQSVMEEIERMHNKKKRPAWMEALGFKKEVMQFLTCLRNISFDFRCFGSIPPVEISSDDDEEEEEEDDYEYADRNHRRKSGGGGGGGGEAGSSGAVFSKWFMILQEENLSKEVTKNVTRPRPDEAAAAEVVPPANALLLMRCRSAPAKSWLEEREEEERERRESEEKKEEEEVEEANYCEFAVEIGKENWIQERICRSRSWKR